ncbi:MAG: elongation factor P maturation arginine rhamnosyltransferase EarP [Shewanella sp.]|nr:elongation factor P maturation arginine rhamnosyltransferase EarP [Shewanella sp.]MCF1430201.1 elongation factor P maturation arginine rhamnosyltransferase EarP [Shewanella sp.]MCF1438066.1 elongation factor P maturation arginine rhamnosyltransferase EarP [Shewanella sp.]MCF1459237.1 elongation factor P maturation arginine rhamnosyltransferase EarP [Shewanella sp.]
MNLQQSHSEHWDIFCVVVDNYGDIGVTWRLAKQLAGEYQLAVNLWVDDLGSFAHILPELNPQLAEQTHQQVRILKWNTPLDQTYIPGAVLIEAFACELPVLVKQAVTSASKPPVWLNLEYLSAEDWVEGCHGLPSFQPGGINKYFYLPGFTDKTGGLICERDLFAQRDAWQADPDNRGRLFSDLGLSGIEPEHRVISLFSYETKALSALCELWSGAAEPIHLLLPKGRSLNSLTHLLPDAPEDLVTGSQIQLGSLTLHILPMTDQQGYDQLLWSCDFNIVRGEDSFVRAQWAARPFIWHIYQQEDDYHLVKLEAFMRLYCDNLAPEVAQSWQQLNLAFNRQQQIDVQRQWLQIDTMRSKLEAHAKHWPVDALKMADLATRLVHFIKK